MSGPMSPPVQSGPITLEEVRERWPTIRQSLLAKFDDCPLSTLFELRYARGWSTHPQARGTLFHRFAAECLRTMRAVKSETIPVAEALQVLLEVVRQRDVPAHEVVRAPLRDMRDLRMAAVKFANDNAFSVGKLVDVEQRLSATVRYDDPVRGMVERTLTGQLDALLFEPPDRAVVIDWKDTWGLPPEPVDVGEVNAGSSDELKGISYHGYFQQRLYGWLVMRNFPAVQSVTLREFYARKTVVRKATLLRTQLDEVEEEMSILAEAFDRAVADGAPAWPYRIAEMGRWVPQPGKHCLAGETRILTDRGVRELRDCEGEAIRVLDRHGQWSDAIVRSFGRQPLVRVMFDDGTIVRATPDHRWWTIAKDRFGRWRQTGGRVTTVELVRAPLATHAAVPSIDPEGVRHGFTFGDGWVRSDRGTAVARIMPHDGDVEQWFERMKWRDNGHGYVYGLPGRYKALPGTASPAYARGFIAGLHAADGKVDRRGGVLIHCEGAERARAIAEIARLGGCVVSSVRVDSDKPTAYSPVAARTRELMAIRLKPATAPVLKGYHRARLRATNQMRRMYRDVVSVEADGVEEVYCAVVPGAESFTLASGLITSNCGYCAMTRRCPIEEDARIEAGGAIASLPQAERAAAELNVVEEARARLLRALKGWVETSGAPVRVRWSKGRRALGWFRTKRGRRFGFYTPDASDRGTHVSDAELEAAMRDATVRARSTRRAA